MIGVAFGEQAWLQRSLLQVALCLAGFLLLITPPGAAGRDWSPAQTVSDPNLFSDLPSVAIGADETTAIAFRVRESKNPCCAGGIVVSAREPGGLFSTPRQVSGDDQGFVVEPVLTVGADGEITVAWSDIENLRVATRPAGADTFLDPETLSTAPGGVISNVSLETASDGSTVAVWREVLNGSSLIHTATRPPGSSTFTKSGAISDPAELAADPVLDIAAGEKVTVAWAASDSPSPATIQISTRSGTVGGFSPPSTISTPGPVSQDASKPTIASDPDGQTTVAWARILGAIDMGVQAATRPIGSDVFSAPVDIFPIPGTTVGPPFLTSGPTGETTIAWAMFDGGQTRTRVSTRAAASSVFTGPSTISSEGFLAPIGLASDSAGQTILLAQFMQSSTSFDSELLESRIRPSGASLFPAPEDLSARGFISEGAPSLATGPNGLATATWALENGGESLIQQASRGAASPVPRLASPVVKGPVRAEKGKRVSYRVTVRNTGNAAATGVKVRVRAKTARATRNLGAIAPGKSKTVKVPLKFGKRGKATVTFTVTSSNAGKKAVKKVVRVR